jgi:hypothetical protein
MAIYQVFDGRMQLQDSRANDVVAFPLKHAHIKEAVILLVSPLEKLVDHFQLPLKAPDFRFDRFRTHLPQWRPPLLDGARALRRLKIQKGRDGQVGIIRAAIKGSLKTIAVLACSPGRRKR